jgi:FlaG/FlaF family flagellin (archaellin)
MRKNYRNKKGLSTVISTILMIMVVMIGMTILFSFVDVYADNYKAGIGSSVLESITISDTWLKSGNTVELWIYNVGSVPVTVEAIYVNNAPLDVTSFTVNSNTIISPNSLNIKGYIPINGQADVVATYAGQRPNSPIIFKIATERGSIFEQSYQG